MDYADIINAVRRLPPPDPGNAAMLLAALASRINDGPLLIDGDALVEAIDEAHDAANKARYPDDDDLAEWAADAHQDQLRAEIRDGVR